MAVFCTKKTTTKKTKNVFVKILENSKCTQNLLWAFYENAIHCTIDVINFSALYYKKVLFFNFRDTITSSGPKSYGKSKQGFTNNAFRKFELSMKPRNSLEKQTTYNPEDDKATK